MFAFIADLRRVREREERAIVVEASDLGGLLVRFLNEANFVFETQHFLFRRFAVVELAHDKRLRARGFGEPVDPTRHHVNSLVKSATYHMLEVAERRGRWRARVILDI
jgi:SHS2 domain-containing protein